MFDDATKREIIDDVFGKFYEKFGFQVRPNENDGAGMQVWRKGCLAEDATESSGMIPK